MAIKKVLFSEISWRKSGTISDIRPRQYSVNGTTALDLEYFYNTHGLVSETRDHKSLDNDREYLYDGQGRLTDAWGPWDFGGERGTDPGHIQSLARSSEHFAENFSQIQTLNNSGMGGTTNIQATQGEIARMGAMFIGSSPNIRPTSSRNGYFNPDNGRSFRFSSYKPRYDAYQANFMQNVPGGDQINVHVFVTQVPQYPFK